MAGIDKGAIKSEFEEKLGRLTQSRAYLDFCEEVYGRRLYLFNMMDSEQLNFMFNSIPLTENDTVLDVGCGTGCALDCLVEKYGCAGVGVDLLNGDAVKSGRIAYIQGDIDRVGEFGLKPTVTLCVDSLYFSGDLSALIKTLCETPNNRLYLFYSQYLFDESADKSALLCENTQLGQALKRAGVPFRAIDFSENERLLYVSSEAALKKRRADFAAEGNADLCEQKLQETLMGLQLYEKRLASRYLYIADSSEKTRR